MILAKWALIVVLLVSVGLTRAESTCPTMAQNAPAPIITRHELKCIAALTIEKGDHEPSEAQYKTIRSVLMQASAMGFNTWRAFFNPDEVREHVMMSVDDPNHLPGFGRTQGLVFIADTIDAVIPKLNDADLNAYVKGLEAMGAMAVVFNDADQYSIEALEQMVGRIRAVSDLPIIASLRASANIESYPMFDYFEAQTFGTASELRLFMELPFDLYCLDARNSMTAATLKERGEIILAASPKAFFYYADLADDWLAIPGEEAEAIKGIIGRGKAAL